MGAIIAPFLIDPSKYAGAIYSPALAMDAGTIQGEILARLVAQQPNYPALAGIEIEAFPDAPESWRALNQIGTVLVRFEGSQYGSVEDTAEVVQSRKLRYRVVVLARGLGWPDAAGVSGQGAYAILEACRNAIIGFKLPGCAKIYAERDEFVQRDKQGGIWIYALDIIVPTWIVENPDPQTLPNLLEGLANNKIAISSGPTDTTGTPPSSETVNTQGAP